MTVACCHFSDFSIWQGGISHCNSKLQLVFHLSISVLITMMFHFWQWSPWVCWTDWCIMCIQRQRNMLGLWDCWWCCLFNMAALNELATICRLVECDKVTERKVWRSYLQVFWSICKMNILQFMTSYLVDVTGCHTHAYRGVYPPTTMALTPQFSCPPPFFCPPPPQTIFG